MQKSTIYTGIGIQAEYLYLTILSREKYWYPLMNVYPCNKIASITICKIFASIKILQGLGVAQAALAIKRRKNGRK